MVKPPNFQTPLVVRYHYCGRQSATGSEIAEIVARLEDRGQHPLRGRNELVRIWGATGSIGRALASRHNSQQPPSDFFGGQTTVGFGGMSRHSGSMIARIRLRRLGVVRQMSAIGTEEICYLS